MPFLSHHQETNTAAEQDQWLQAWALAQAILNCPILGKWILYAGDQPGAKIADF